jgi:hypothetical protein
VYVSVTCYLTNKDGGNFLTVRCLGQEDSTGPISLDKDYAFTFESEEIRGKERNAKVLRKKATKLETSLAESVGGRRHKGSGSLGHLKGDGRLKGKIRMESKFTQCKSFSVTLEDLHKLLCECDYKEDPAFEVTFTEPGTLKIVDQWVMIPRQTWEKYVAATYNQ